MERLCKTLTHAAGFGLFGDLQIKQDLDLSSHFGVETDVYMFFKYPDTEEILVDETVVKAVEIGEAKQMKYSQAMVLPVVLVEQLSIE